LFFKFSLFPFFYPLILFACQDPAWSWMGQGEGIMIRIHCIVKFLIGIGLMTLFLGCAARQNRESTGGYVDDSVITTKVKTAIFNEASLNVFQISVETFKGEVRLSGFVDSAQSVSKAGEIAGKVAGVRSVRNNLAVK